MTVWYRVRRFMGAEAARFRSYADAVAWRDSNCSSGSVVPLVVFDHPGRPLY